MKGKRNGNKKKVDSNSNSNSNSNNTKNQSQNEINNQANANANAHNTLLEELELGLGPGRDAPNPIPVSPVPLSALKISSKRNSSFSFGAMSGMSLGSGGSFQLERNNHLQSATAAPENVATSLNNGIAIRPRKTRHSISTPFRSHFSSKLGGDSSFDQDSIIPVITSQSVREQTMSWTYRQLNGFDHAYDKRFSDEYGGGNSPDIESYENSPSLGASPLVHSELGSLYYNENFESGFPARDAPDPETVPLLAADQSDGNLADISIPTTQSYFNMFIDYTGIMFYSLPAVCLAVMLTLLDAMSYGIIIFPQSDPHIPVTGPQNGMSIFLASTIISQIVYTGGGSQFKGAVGSMMIEVMPFLHIICQTIETQMMGSSDEAIMATIMAAYSLSTILTGVVFLLIGVFKLGNIVQFFPRHILVGCIGGIGLFLLLTGIEVTARIPPVLNYDFILQLLSPNKLALWSSAFIAAIILKLLQSFIHNPLLVPIYYFALPLLFYILVYFFSIPLQELRDHGWLFNFDTSHQIPFYTFYSLFNFPLVDWFAVLETLPTQLALTFFGILHVPINVPALSVSTQQEVDLSHEIVGHGVSNIVAGLCGTTQNYMVYSNSLIYIRSGGNSRTSGIMLVLFTILLWIKGSFIISYVPSIVVGSLIFHLGIDLLKESVWDTWSFGMHRLEYATILVIVAVMGFVGFTEGIMIGILLACVFFVVMYANRSVIRDTFTGRQARSTVHRMHRHQMFLDKVGGLIRVVKMQGYMFFGTVSQLETYLADLLLENKQNAVRFVVLDFTLISGVDYSGLETFMRIKRKVAKEGVQLLFCGINLTNIADTLGLASIVDNSLDQEGDELVFPLGSQVRVFAGLVDALEWAENYLLETYYVRTTKKADARAVPSAFAEEGRSAGISETPRSALTNLAADLVVKEYPLYEGISKPKHLPFITLMHAFADTSLIPDELLDLLAPEFTRIEFNKGQVVYESGDWAGGLYIVETGQLGLSIISSGGGGGGGGRLQTRQESQAKIVVETLLPGAIVGALEMISGRPRICALVCLSDVCVWWLSKEKYEKLCNEEPAFMLQFVGGVCAPFDVTRLYNTLNHFSVLR